MHPLPILLIHGFNGSTESWHASGFVDALVARGADPALLRTFDYGQSDLGRYDSQGDIRRIASRLVRRESNDPAALGSQIARLSEASVARGGAEKVTIIAHSMGGLIARYYLSRREADEFGTINEGLVGRLITIATPHQGLALSRLVALVPKDALIVRLLTWLERLGVARGASAELAALDAQAKALQQWGTAESVPVTTQGYLDSAAVRQMLPGSPFMGALAAGGAWPEGVEGALIWGDVQLSATVRWGRLPLWERAVTLGDLLVEAASAGALAIPTVQRFPLLWRRDFEVRLGDPALVPADLNRYLPPVSHSNLVANPEVHAIVGRLLGL